jgi:hypothetical protein|tara:strand:- start:2438 stop:2617 length:180 start_codon:yes stop_codon:yes gene_type:complete
MSGHIIEMYMKFYKLLKKEEHMFFENDNRKSNIRIFIVITLFILFFGSSFVLVLNSIKA